MNLGWSEENETVLNISKGPGDLDFLTWSSPDGRISPIQQVEQATREIAEHLEVTGAVLLHERYYGDLEMADSLLDRREKVRTELGLENGLPPTYVEGKSCFSSPLAGIHAISARPATAGATELVRWNDEISGRSVEGKDGLYLYLTDLARLVPQGHQVGPGPETKSTFDIAGEILESQGWTFGEVCRTWFYLQNILDWYDEFNDVRNRYFEGIGLFNSDSNAMIPASTGILGSNIRRGWCTLDLLATRGTSGNPIEIKRLVNPYQNEAPEYGSAFSRGLALTMGQSHYVLVSGTASIDDEGMSIFVGDFERQTNQTLETIEALLKQGGAQWADVCQATAFIKRPEDVPVFQRLIDERGLQDIPIVFTIADVCREELLFELDATAALPKPVKGHGSS